MYKHPTSTNYLVAPCPCLSPGRRHSCAVPMLPPMIHKKTHIPTTQTETSNPRHIHPSVAHWPRHEIDYLHIGGRFETEGHAISTWVARTKIAGTVHTCTFTSTIDVWINRALTTHGFLHRQRLQNPNADGQGHRVAGFWRAGGDTRSV